MSQSPPKKHINTVEEGCVAYLAPQGFLPDLQQELGDNIINTYDHLVLARNTGKPPMWAANVWLDPTFIQIESIGDAAKKLRAIQRNWALYPVAMHRRVTLIAEQLPKVSAKPLVFGAAPPKAPLGSWTLIDATQCWLRRVVRVRFPTAKCSLWKTASIRQAGLT